MADEYTIKLYTDADFNEVFTYQQSDGTVFDLTNYDAEILIGHAGETRLISASTTDTITINGPAGQVTVNIPKASIAAHGGKSCRHQLNITSPTNQTTRLIGGPAIISEGIS